MEKGIHIYTKDGRKIVKGLAYYECRELNDLRELVKGSAAKYGDTPGFKFKDQEGNIVCRTYIDFDREIDCVGTALISMGLKEAHISMIGENSYDWSVCYFAVVNGTGVAVPLDKYLPQNEVGNLIDRGNVEAIFYSPAFHDMMVDISKSNNKLKYYICMRDTADVEEGDDRFITLPALIEKGKKLLDEGDSSFTHTPIDRSGMSILLFTSGTTNISKGVMLSHSNIASNVISISKMLYAGPGDVHLSLLPLHHTFENTIGLVLMVYRGVCITYCDGIKHIAKNLKEYRVTVLVAVPAILEAMYRKLNEGIRKSGKAWLFKILVFISETLRAVGIDLRRKLFKSILNQIGPGLRLAVSGAAPLDPSVVTGFDKIGFRLVQGYGLTEASPVVAANNDFINKTGTIGHPLADIEVAIDSPDENGMGELITRGSNVMIGYYEDPHATAEAIDNEGWLRTGDLAAIDDKGYIRITGRAKSMIVFTNGKKAFPEEYEILLNNIEGVKDSFAWGNEAPDGDIQVCTKLVIDKEGLCGEDGSMPSEEELAQKFNTAIKNINKTIPAYKIIRYFVMSHEDLVKTTTLKIKRPVEYKKVMEALDKAGLDMRKASGTYI
jgi:long-chain acyl-CoA synthetase